MIIQCNNSIVLLCWYFINTCTIIAVWLMIYISVFNIKYLYQY